jgi:hypothetical protein
MTSDLLMAMQGNIVFCLMPTCSVTNKLKSSQGAGLTVEYKCGFRCLIDQSKVVRVRMCSDAKETKARVRPFLM